MYQSYLTEFEPQKVYSKIKTQDLDRIGQNYIVILQNIHKVLYC